METSSLRNLIWKRFSKNKLAVAGGIMWLSSFLVAVFAPFFSPYNPDDIDRKHILVS
jgi:ABC-type antimicrobial peptide transport system permease subunit